MGTPNISYLNLLFLALLVIPIIFLLKKIGLNFGKKITVSIVRMVLQLSLVGLYLQYIFDMNIPLLTIAYIILMMGVATYSIGSSSPLQLKAVFPAIFISLLIPNILMIMFFNGIVVRLDHLFDARFLITIGGMLLGNGLSGNIVGLTTFYNGISKKEKEYQYVLALGASHFEAIKPYFKEAIMVSINPTIASMATIGLVALPGMMTGQILGGSVPMEAIKYQIAIMIAIFVTKFFNIVLAIHLSNKKMFTKTLQLNKQYLTK